MPNKDLAIPAAAAESPTRVSATDPSIVSRSQALKSAPPMSLPVPAPGPAIRFLIGAPSIAGFVPSATLGDIHPQALSRPAQIDRTFAVSGNLIKPLPEGFHHPLLSKPPEPADQEPLEDPDPTAEQWAELRWCESSGNYGAVNFSGRYRGAYQFDQETWDSVGGSGDPATADPAEQDKRAKILYATRGSAPWPYCGRYLDS